MSQVRRHERIRALIARQPVGSQEELRRLLAREGITATQATLSRDLKALGVVKAPQGYVLPSQTRLDWAQPGSALERSLAAYALACDRAQNLIVLKTGPGRAQALAAELDRTPPDGVLGTIAGDDTILVIVRTEARAKWLEKEWREVAALGGTARATGRRGRENAS